MNDNLLLDKNLIDLLNEKCSTQLEIKDYLDNEWICQLSDNYFMINPALPGRI